MDFKMYMAWEFVFGMKNGLIKVEPNDNPEESLITDLGIKKSQLKLAYKLYDVAYNNFDDLQWHKIIKLHQRYRKVFSSSDREILRMKEVLPQELEKIFAPYLKSSLLSRFIEFIKNPKGGNENAS